VNLVWHIAKKDIRRLAWPWALWLAFVAGSAAWFRLAAPPSVGDTPPAFVEWVAVMKVWTLLIGIGLCLVAGLLVGALGTEDPVSGSSGFWRTRPIGRLRLLAAKLLAGAILFLIAPTIAWAALWASWGFTIEELLASTRDTAVGWAAYALPAFTLAALSRTLVQFVYLSALAVAGLVAISFILAELFLGRSPGPLLPIQPDGLLWLYLAVCGAALVQHYLRPSWRTWLTMGLGLPLVLEFGYWREYEAGKRRTAPRVRA
jgi:signal transduction histidine kinase